MGNTIIPKLFSKYKKLLWTNPSPTSAFAEQTISLDLSDFDAVEVVYKLYMSQQYDVTGQLTYMSNQTVTVAASGTTGFFNGADAPMARTSSMSSEGVHFSAGSLCGGSSNWTVNNNVLIPYKIYGISYNKLLPPAEDASDYVVEQGTSGDWTYRKWTSGIAECWGKKSMGSINITDANGYLYDAITGTEAFPSGLFTSAPTISAITHNPSGGRFLTLMIVSASANGVSFKVVSSISGSISFDYDIHAIGRWK